MSKSLYFAIVILVFCELEFGNCQNCRIGDLNDGDSITLGPFSELTDANTVIWSANTEDITGAASSSSPHFPYIEGLRYTSRYEYRTSSIFSTFIAKERSTSIQRNVLFTCSDQSTIQVHFTFEVSDENNSPPQFTQSQSEFVLRKLGQSGLGKVNTGTKIAIRDLDWDEENARVKVSTSHPTFTAMAQRNPNVPFEEAYEFEVDLWIDWDVAVLGTYSFDILASDGRFAEKTAVNVTVLP